MLGNGSAQGFPSASVVKNLPEVQETQVWSQGWKDPPEEGMAAHCRLLAWRSPWTEEPGGLQPTGSQGVGHDRVAEQERGTRVALLTCTHPVGSTHAGFIHGPLSTGFDSEDGSQWL